MTPSLAELKFPTIVSQRVSYDPDLTTRENASNRTRKKQEDQDQGHVRNSQRTSVRVSERGGSDHTEMKGFGAENEEESFRVRNSEKQRKCRWDGTQTLLRLKNPDRKLTLNHGAR